MTGVWLIIRFTGIALGIITLLGFASGYMNVEFKPYVKEALTSLQYFADFIIQPELIERGLDYLRQHFAWVPRPEAHWKPIYTLSALFMLSFARSNTNWYAIPVALVCSLIPAVFAGTMPVGSGAVFAWPLAGVFAMGAILERSQGHWSGRSDIGMAVLAAFSAATGYFFNTTGESTDQLVLIASCVGFVGLFLLLAGILIVKGTLWQRLETPGVVIGLNITATLGGALFIGWLFTA
jgi:hypothetical protein